MNRDHDNHRLFRPPLGVPYIVTGAILLAVLAQVFT